MILKLPISYWRKGSSAEGGRLTIVVVVERMKRRESICGKVVRKQIFEFGFPLQWFLESL